MWSHVQLSGLVRLWVVIYSCKHDVCTCQLDIKLKEVKDG